jgi:hypothetical protein
MALRLKHRFTWGSTAASVATAGARTSGLDFIGDLDAALALVAVPAETARAMLPEGLRLAPQRLTPATQHPLLFVLGRQRKVRLALFSFGLDYLESILVVPFVEHARPERRPRGPFGWLPCLLLDRPLPVLAGRLLLAYAKQRAVIEATDDSYRIACARTGAPLLSARFSAAGASFSGCPRPLAEILRLPVISRRARGAWRYSVAGLDLERAEVRPIAIDLTIERPLVPGLPTGAFRLEAEAGRALRLRTSWRLTGPWARRSPRPLEAGQRHAEPVT